ncbi:glycoside hydrolase family 30 protein [Hymenobacter rubripertinctus]|uniref:Glucosylceramidase n=1 Tax=Hymenobacter rubripertinctus TaxID=2029981 RepID=A0A418R0W4_9BACT|nr:glycoside hydrolase family 30 beta sandwich domain-containing protein [Hymenobacter rubripertinctus]RIY11072.1 glucosylceramidase [Hymenobacter rubripertinctus]
MPFSARFFRPLALLLTLGWGAGCQRPAAEQGGAAAVQFWLTNPDKSALFQPQPAPVWTTAAAPADADEPVLEVDDRQTYQTMDGFGYCLTGGSAGLLHAMSPAARAALLRELFSPAGTGIGVSYLRLSIGASDLDAAVFSYDDLPAGQTDPELAHFSLAPDRVHLLPVLREILAINPDIKLMASPWSPPVWMKTNGSSKGGSLRPEFYPAYAQYFVQYVRQMRAEGVRIDAVTVQNEPLHPGNNPSLLMPAGQQAEFVKHLGPAFEKAGLATKIIIYDHNADRPDYPLTVLADSAARRYIDGTAFHLYAGPIEALSQVHDAYPDKHVYFTEQWVGAKSDFAGNLPWHVRTLLIGATRNWARTVLEWNLAADPQQNPHTPGGCTECRGALTLAGDIVTREDAYYIIAHASKFVRPGSVRIASTASATLPNVAFRTPTGQRVVIMQNNSPTARAFALRYQGRVFRSRLPAGAAATYVW